MALKVDIKKDFGAFRLDVAFEAGDETLALLGASGCGKTMTLKMIAGIERPDEGVIELDGVTLFDSKRKIDLKPQQRHVGLMFQNYALFENMTVRRNILMGVREDRRSEAAKQEVEAVMDCLHIAELADRHPSQISGGQQQRVALARIMVSHPNILMLDEPFSALDQHLRFKLETFVHEAIADFQGTVLWVSHDRDEVYRRCDRIAIMDEGHIDAIGPVEEVFDDPKTVAGAVLTGCKNILRAERADACHVRLPEHGVLLTVPEAAGEIDQIGIRRHYVMPVAEGDAQAENQFDCVVMGETANPFSYILDLALASAPTQPFLSMEIDKGSWEAARAREISVHVDPSDILLLKS